MLDWRGLIGTAAVHVVAALAPLSPVLGVPICLCDLPGDPGTITLPAARPHVFAIMSGPTLGRDIRQAAVRLDGTRCGDRTRRLDELPSLLSGRPLPAGLVASDQPGAGPSLCVLVGVDGAVIRVRALSPGSAALASYARRLRFRPAVLDGEPVSVEVELGLL